MISKRRKVCETDDLDDYLAMGSSTASLFKILSKTGDAGESERNFKKRTEQVHARILDKISEKVELPLSNGK